MKKIALISFGCAKNLVDSEIMLGYIDQAGHAFVTDPKDADVIILNTCGFIEPAQKRSAGCLERRRLNQEKRRREKSHSRRLLRGKISR
ncbi:MAG: hypothetical protein OEV50_05700 [Candidatus Aminicenantes bacterium]|nr:hypothetical protein [Candidatus Aminicenantes bacterium]